MDDGQPAPRKKVRRFHQGLRNVPGVEQFGRSITAEFDIEARFDKVRGLPTSVKSSGNEIIALSDARRFFAIARDFRMIVGRYRQVGQQKIFAEFTNALSPLRPWIACAVNSM